MISENVLNQQLQSTLEKTSFSMNGAQRYEGKVRDCYITADKRILVTTDRISAFDVVLTTLPFKGQVLNQMSQFWFEQTKKIVKNHVLDIPDPNVTVAINCTPIPVEFVVRGYITGVTTTSMWYHYEKGARVFCGYKLPEGLKKDQKLERPLVTPSTKAEKGGHDESVSREEIIKRGLMTAEDFDKVAAISLKLYETGVKIAAKQGIILVDTKYEFGKDADGNIVLIDEIHTPDSSRFWFADTYQQLFDEGKEQRKIDKEYVRKWLADQGFRGEGKVPPIPAEIRVEAARRYIQAFELITGQKFVASAGSPVERIHTNLVKKGYLKG